MQDGDGDGDGALTPCAAANVASAPNKLPPLAPSPDIIRCRAEAVGRKTGTISPSQVLRYVTHPIDCVFERLWCRRITFTRSTRTRTHTHTQTDSPEQKKKQNCFPSLLRQNVSGRRDEHNDTIKMQFNPEKKKKKRDPIIRTLPSSNNDFIINIFQKPLKQLRTSCPNTR